MKAAWMLLMTLILAITPLVSLSQSIQSVQPGLNAIHVPAASVVSVTFDTDMDPATITDATFLVYGNLTGRYSGTIGYDAGSRTAFFDPDNDFVPGEDITATVTTGIQTSGGTPLDNNFIWSFTARTGAGPRNYGFDSSYVVGGAYDLGPADFDGDGDIDLSVALQDSNEILILANDGSGTFSPVTTAEAGTKVRYHFVADFDGDGYPDIAALFVSTPTFGIFLNDGSGLFPTHDDYTGPDTLSEFTTGDFNGDGYIDLATISHPSFQLSIFPNQGDGTFGTRMDFPLTESHGFIEPGDIDNDGDLDLAVSYSVMFYPADTSLYIYYNDGTGDFTNVTGPYLDGESAFMDFADINGDSYIDLAVTPIGTGPQRLFVIENDGAGALNEFEYDSVEFYYMPTFMSVDDLDGDGYNDIVAACWGAKDKSASNMMIPATLSIVYNSGLGYFLPYTYFEIPDYYFFLLWDVVTADFNGDGILDLATSTQTGLGADRDTGGVCIFFNTEADILCGDVNGSSTVDVGDVVYLINFIFRGGPPPNPMCKGDATGDGNVNIGDAVYMIAYIFRGGPLPDINCCP